MINHNLKCDIDKFNNYNKCVTQTMLHEYRYIFDIYDVGMQCRCCKKLM